MTDPQRDLEQGLNGYAAFRRRYGEPEYAFEDALREHRRQVLANMIDDSDPGWMIRNGQLEKLAEAKGVTLAGEPTVADVLAARRHATVARRKAANG